MCLPIGFNDLSLWLAIMAIILLTTSELVSPYYGETGLAAEKKKIRNAALFLALCFIATAVIKVYEVALRFG